MKMMESKFIKIKIPADPEDRSIFNPPTGSDGRGRASGVLHSVAGNKKTQKKISINT